MATDTVDQVETLELGPFDAGVPLTVEEFEAADFELGHQYELIHGVLIVSPVPSIDERYENDYLGYMLLGYQEQHPNGSALDSTSPEWEIVLRKDLVRRLDRVIWAGLGRSPVTRGPIEARDLPTIVVELPSERAADLRRDYEEKRDDYRDAGIKEYWIIDRFRREMTVFAWIEEKWNSRVIPEEGAYESNLLPGFIVKPAKVFAASERHR